jgi:hypothetical protein
VCRQTRHCVRPGKHFLLEKKSRYLYVLDSREEAPKPEAPKPQPTPASQQPTLQAPATLKTLVRSNEASSQPASQAAKPRTSHASTPHRRPTSSKCAGLGLLAVTLEQISPHQLWYVPRCCRWVGGERLELTNQHEARVAYIEYFDFEIGVPCAGEVQLQVSWATGFSGAPIKLINQATRLASVCFRWANDRSHVRCPTAMCAQLTCKEKNHCSSTTHNHNNHTCGWRRCCSQYYVPRCCFPAPCPSCHAPSAASSPPRTLAIVVCRSRSRYPYEILGASCLGAPNGNKQPGSGTTEMGVTN